MRSKSLFAITMLSLIPGLAFARPRNSASVQLDEPVKVGNVQIPSGDYKMVWEGNTPNVTVSFLDGDKTVATAPAELVNKTNKQDAIETFTAPDNTEVLQAVDLKNLSVRFENTAIHAGN